MKDSVCDITLPRLTKRRVLEENEELVPRVSTLEKELEEEFKLMEEKKEEEKKKKSLAPK